MGVTPWGGGPAPRRGGSIPKAEGPEHGLGKMPISGGLLPECGSFPRHSGAPGPPAGRRPARPRLSSGEVLCRAAWCRCCLVGVRPPPAGSGHPQPGPALLLGAAGERDPCGRAGAVAIAVLPAPSSSPAGASRPGAATWLHEGLGWERVPVQDGSCEEGSGSRGLSGWEGAAAGAGSAQGHGGWRALPSAPGIGAPCWAAPGVPCLPPALAPRWLLHWPRQG